MLSEGFEYFSAFSEKNIDKLRSMFSIDVSLRDWEIEATGIEEVLKANKKIFENVDSIKVRPLSIYNYENSLIMCKFQMLYPLFVRLRRRAGRRR